jgi:excisionase family DNA binding protein
MKLIQAKRASELLSVSLQRLYELARLGIVPVVRLGPRQIRFDEDALIAWARSGGLSNHGGFKLSEMSKGDEFAQIN